MARGLIAPRVTKQPQHANGKIFSYVFNELPPEERAWVKQHLGRCNNCAAVYREMMKGKKIFRQWTLMLSRREKRRKGKKK